MARNLSHEMLLYVNFQSSHWSVYDLGPNSGDLDAGNYIKKKSRIRQQLELDKECQQTETGQQKILVSPCPE